MCVLGVLSIDQIIEFKKKYLVLLFLVPLTLFIASYQTYDHDFIKLFEEEERYWVPFILAIATIAILLFPLKHKYYSISLSVLSLFLIISSARTFDLNPEDATMKKAGKWFARNLEQGKRLGDQALFTKNSRIACSHILFYYFSDKYKSDYVNPPIIDFTKEATDTLRKGDIVVWESHYGHRPKLRPTSQPYEFYDKNADFEKIQYYQSKDNRFLIAFFRKIRD